MTSLIKFNSNEKELGFPSFPSLFDDFLIKDLFNIHNRDFTSAAMPPVNIKETKNSYNFEMAVPGMNKEDFKIELDNNNLLVSAEHKSVKDENETDRFYKKEFNFQSFKRVFQLPGDNINEEEIKASYVDGILHISVAKKNSENKLLKEIPVE